MKTVGETLIDLLEANGVEVVFGIPGVHTVELYRGLAASRIHHVTPRHEQGAGFMADGYARVSGKPGVALVITGPGLANTITAMGQAAADSVPLLIISGVNRRSALGHGRGLLHEAPDQRALVSSLVRYSHTLLVADDLADVVERAFFVLRSGRPGPVHIEIPTDVMGLRIASPTARFSAPCRPRAEGTAIEAAAGLLNASARPLILAGGGTVRAGPALTQLAEALDAPVVLTANARGLLARHPLRVPASASLPAIRKLIAESDCILALGTELGQTDYDSYDDGGLPDIADRLIRVDIDAAQLARRRARLALLSSVAAAVDDLLPRIVARTAAGAMRAKDARDAAWAALSGKMQREIAILDVIREALPGCILVGDSTQAVYAGNLYCEIDRPLGWFNAATGFGALGYAAPAAVGAAIAEPGSAIVCLAGDGGLQFTLAEIGSAADAAANVIFLVWNNDGYQEIESFMIANGIAPEGVRPSAPNFCLIAEAYGLKGTRLADIGELPQALRDARAAGKPALIEIHEKKTRGVSG